MIRVGAGAYAGIGIELRGVSARGFGGSLAFRAAGPLSFDLLDRNAQSPSITMLAVDLAAIYRARLVGDDRENTAITLGAGVSFTSLDGNSGRPAATCGFLAWDCVEPAYTPPAADLQRWWSRAPARGRRARHARESLSHGLRRDVAR